MIDLTDNPILFLLPGRQGGFLKRIRQIIYVQRIPSQVLQLLSDPLPQ